MFIYGLCSSCARPCLLIKLVFYALNVINLSGCQRALGMENGAIFDVQISASSQHSANYLAVYARLHFEGEWIAVVNDVNQWLQVDLGTTSANVTRVATQGRYNGDSWVKSYNLQYGDDGLNFQYYRELGQSTDKVGWLIDSLVSSFTKFKVICLFIQSLLVICLDTMKLHHSFHTPILFYHRSPRYFP